MIPQTIIDKLRLQLSKDTIGVSFIHKARIFTWPAVTDVTTTVFLMECDLEGVPLPEDSKQVTVLARWTNCFKSMTVSIELLEMYDARSLATFMHKQLQKKSFIRHDWRAEALKKRRRT